MNTDKKDINRVLLLAVSGIVPPSGGIGRYLSNLINRGRLSGVIIAPHEGPRPLPLDRERWKLYRTRPFWKRRYLRKISFLEVLLIVLVKCRRMKPDFIVCSHIGLGLPGLFLKKFFRRPLIMFGYGLEIVSGRFLFFRRTLYKNADLVITISAFSREMLLAAGVKKDKIRILPPSVDTAFFYPHQDVESIRERYSINRNSLNLLTVSRLDPGERYKGHDQTIRSLAKVLRQFPDIDYLIAGTGKDTPRLLSIVREAGVERHVKFLGFVPEKDLPSLYSLCDIFIMPSREIRDQKMLKYEGFGIVFLEANACGTPVIGGNSGGIPDVVEDGVNGLLVEPQGPDKIAEAILKLIRDPAYREKLGKNGLKRTRENYDCSVAAGKFSDILKQDILEAKALAL